MRRWVLFVVLLGVVALALPLTASAGWGNSPYDKSDCTYSKETNSMYCETIVNHEVVKTEEVRIADASCPSGFRLFSRTGTFVEPTLVFDGFDGPSPNANRNTFGDDVPLLGEEFWKDFSDTEIGCLVEP